jgi:hypothetical protein
MKLYYVIKYDEPFAIRGKRIETWFNCHLSVLGNMNNHFRPALSSAAGWPALETNVIDQLVVVD